MTAPDPAFLRRAAASIRYCDYGPIVNQYAEAQAARFDAQADELEARERLAIDIGLVATEASEGVAYGSEPDDFFRAAGEAVLCWLPLNGFHVITAEQAKDVRIVLNATAGFRKTGKDAALSAKRLRESFLLNELATEEL